MAAARRDAELAVMVCEHCTGGHDLGVAVVIHPCSYSIRVNAAHTTGRVRNLQDNRWKKLLPDDADSYPVHCVMVNGGDH